MEVLLGSGFLCKVGKVGEVGVMIDTLYCIEQIKVGSGLMSSSPTHANSEASIKTHLPLTFLDLNINSSSSRRSAPAKVRGGPRYILRV